MTGRAIVHLGRRYHFCASHRLHTDTLSDTENRDTYGKCNNPFGHGHNYIVDVSFSGPVDAATGMVVDLGLLDAFARERIVERFNHQNLNMLPEFAHLVPTTENLSVVVHAIFAQFVGVKLERVHVEETGNNSFDFGGDGGLRM